MRLRCTAIVVCSIWAFVLLGTICSTGAEVAAAEAPLLPFFCPFSAPEGGAGRISTTFAPDTDTVVKFIFPQIRIFDAPPSKAHRSASVYRRFSQGSAAPAIASDRTKVRASWTNAAGIIKTRKTCVASHCGKRAMWRSDAGRFRICARPRRGVRRISGRLSPPSDNRTTQAFISTGRIHTGLTLNGLRRINQ